MRVAFIGPVGAGKTTQAQRLALALPNYVPRVSSGELVRAHIEAKTELGRRMRGYYHRGEAVHCRGRGRRARGARAPGAVGVLCPGSLGRCLPSGRRKVLWFGGELPMRHEEFAERTVKRLEAVADRLEEEGRRLGVYGAVSARAGEMRLAALLTREEAEAVTRAELTRAERGA